MELKPGMRLRSVSDTTEVVVVKSRSGSVDVRCGGHPMVDIADPAVIEGRAGGTLVGKRYGDDEIGVEVLCTKAGEGSISLNGLVVEPKGSKPLPSSD